MKYTAIFFVALCFGFAAAKCKYRRDGDWTSCSAEALKTRTDVLKAQKSDANCHPTRNISKVCREDCQYEKRRQASWTECDQLSNTVTGTRQLVSGAGCPAQVAEVFDCRIQRRFDRKAADRRAGKKNQRKLQRKAQRRQNKQQNRAQRRLERKQRRQQRRQSRQNRQEKNN